jgi:F420-dependent methylenetetrahydromethanopterin dehydrogenase
MSEPMPVFILKAKDNLTPWAVANYAILCEAAGLCDQAEEVRKALAEMVNWRDEHREQCKWPDHDHVPAGQPGSGSD